MARLEIEALRRRRGGEEAVAGLEMSVEGGEVRALLGERRTGKSSLVRLVAGSDWPDSGEILIDGRSLAGGSRWRPGSRPARALGLGVGVLFQESSLMPTLTAAENILTGRREFGFGRRKAEALRAAAEHYAVTAARWRLSPDPGVPVKRLTRLEATVAELARATAFGPAVLLLDEPAGRFSADELQVLYGVVAEARAAGAAVVYVASTAEEVLRVADRVSIMKGGRIVETLEVSSLDREAFVDLASSFTESREELVRKNIELLKYRRYSEEIISNLPLGSVILDTRGSIYLANGAALAFLAAGESAAAWSPRAGLEELLGKVDGRPREEIARAVREGRRGEWREVPVEGGRTLSALVFPFHDQAGRALGTILALQDISEELATREYLVRAERSASIAELAAGVAHEVNNPLAIISNYVELLLARPQEDYSADRLAIIKSEIKRIHGIVASLLTFSRMDGAAIEDTDLAKVSSDSLLLLAHEAELRGIDLRAELPPGPFPAKADPSRLKQVIINLVVNALEALSPGGTVRVSLTRSESGEEALLSVADDGPGIDPSVLAGLFRPFTRSTKGPTHAGLGLSVCRRIVEAHGGTISCESRPGSTVFRVVLPIAGLRGTAAD